MSTDEELSTGFDPNARELCPDGACIGIIGADGRCAECGKVSTKKPKTRPADPDPEGAEEAPPPTAVLDGEGSGPTAEAAPRQVEGDTFDPDHRELCPDGACIGVIGPDGRCAECGTASSGGGAPKASKASSVPVAEKPDPTDPPGAPTDPDGDSEDGQEDADITERRLCPDGACIGVIGSNGRCKECGTRAD